MSELLCDFPELKVFIENLMQNRVFQYPLNLDVVNLTLILRAVGFEINSFDFKPQNPEILTPENLENSITIEVRCEKSGLFSKMNLKSNTCGCPSKVLPRKNEIAVNEALFNILPDVDSSLNSLTSLFFGFLINLYKNERKNQCNITPTSTKKIKIETKTITKELQAIQIFGDCQIPSTSGLFESPIISDDATSTISPFSTPHSSLNITPTESSEPVSIKAERPNLNEYVRPLPKITLNDITLVDATSTPPAEGIENTQNDNFNTSFINKETENDNNTYIIKRLVDAQRKIDEALLYIKSKISQKENCTPKNKKGLNKRDMPNIPMNSINRRNSIGSVKPTLSSKIIPVKPAVSSKLIKPISKIGSNQTSASKKDTPRLGLMYRSPTSKTVANNKNTTAIIKPNPVSRTGSKPILAVGKIVPHKK